MFDKKAYAKQYYEKNKDKIAEKIKEYREAHKEHLSSKAKEYWSKNRERMRDWRKEYIKNATSEQKERWLKSQEKYIKANPERRIISLIKSRAKKNNIDFNLDESDIVIPSKCPVLNIDIHKEHRGKGGKKGPQSNSPSVDRIDNAKGYVKGNIQIISIKANVMKNSASPEELLQFAFWVILTYGHLIDKEISGQSK